MIFRISIKKRIEYRWLVFITAAIGAFVSALDQTSVNVALPSIANHFGSTLPAVQWIALGYVLTTGALLMPMGRLSDFVGRKRVYTFGFTIFTLGAALTATSPVLISVIFFKVLQGVGAAMVQATGMAIVTATFPSAERGRVIGMFLSVVGIGAIIGPIVGGLVVDLFGWRYIFFLGLPFGIASIVTGLLFLEDDGEFLEERRRTTDRFDWIGAALSSGGLALFLLVITNGHRIGWKSPPVVLGLATVVALFVGFVWWQRRTTHPMLALELFRRRSFALGSAASFLSFLAGMSVFFLMPFYLQGVLGYTAGQSGLMIAPTAAFFALAGPISGRLSDKYGYRRFAVLGVFISLASMVILSSLSEDSPLELVITALILQGLGMGIFFSPNASSVLSTVESARFGIATAFVNMSRNASNLVGVALATTVVTAVMASQGFEPSLEEIASAASNEVRVAFTLGLQTSYRLMTGFLAVALVLAAVVGKSSPPDSARGAQPRDAHRGLTA